MSRETILAEIARKISVIPGITTVSRKPIQTAKELNDLPFTQFPVVNVTGGLPSPPDGRAIELAEESADSAIISELDVFIRVFGYNKDTPDTEVSTLLNLIYQNLYYDATLKGYDWTDKASNVNVSTGTIIYGTEIAISDDVKFRNMRALEDFGVIADLTTLPYTVLGKFLDVTDTTQEICKSVSVNPSTIIEYRDPFLVFMLILRVKYIHTTYEI